MKLTVPLPIVFPFACPNSVETLSPSFGDRSHTEKSFNFFQNICRAQTGATRQRPVYRLERTNRFYGIRRGVHTLSFDSLNSNITINVPEFGDDCRSASLVAGRRIFFRTQPSKTSVELLSLTTGLCSVRVKNKATGEATLLLSVKI